MLQCREVLTIVILDDIIKRKKERIEEEMGAATAEGWKQKLQRSGLHKPLDFFKAVKQEGKLSVIAEIKKASPSKGIIRSDFEPVQIARDYIAAGAQAVSVLTEKDFFQGDDSHFVKARQVLPIPLLRKDFIIDYRQIYQSRFLGADAILLIAAVLTDEDLLKFRAVAGILGMQCIVETHDEAEVERALQSGAKIIGINNRDLRSFKVDLRTTERLINMIPPDRAVVSESGIATSEDMVYLRKAGADAVLVGEAFMKAGDIHEKAKELGMAGVR